ncbi:MAG: NADH-quinone oxidoreductase subunit J [Nitrospinae bacterium]|nr:NADH-quinone oxidoreductase subunit J [Nitrospinota bacterium]
MCLNPALAPELEKRIPMMEFLDQLWSLNLNRETVFGLFEEGLVFAIGMTAILASLGVILCATPIYSALYLIGNMICLAILFLLYNAEFLAVVQVVVYAGAVMILFLFIIALLGAKKEERELSFQNLACLGFVGLLFCELLMSMMVGKTKPVEGQVTREMVQQVGSAKAIGIELFSHHIIPFELASLLLLVAAVGIICLAKFSHKPLRKRTRV